MNREPIDTRLLALQDTISGLETFNRSVSHDLRAPIAGILGLARLADAALQRNDDSVARRMLPLIASQAECCTRMIAALMDLAQVDQIELARREVDLKPLLLEVIDQLSLSEPGLPLPQIVIQRLPAVSADEQVLRPALLNLIANALKFTRGCPQPRIEIGGHDHAGGATIFVRDNGVGFDAAAAAHKLFSPFVRLHGERYDGHGVGLSIVRRAVGRHGGRVWAKASAGRGACFYVWLPALSAACAEPPAEQTHAR